MNRRQAVQQPSKSIEYNQTLLKVRGKTLVQDKWNGFGGKVEKGETIPAAAARNLTRYVSLNIFSP